MEEKKLKIKCLKLIYIILIVAIILITTFISKEWNVSLFLRSVMKILGPFLGGFFLAWLLNPLVVFLERKGVKRGVGTLFAYLVLLTVFIFLISVFLPKLYSEMHDFALTLPGTIKKINAKYTSFRYLMKDRFNIQIEPFDFSTLFKINSGGRTVIVSWLKGFLGGSIRFLMSLVIGFYLLLDFNKIENWIKEKCRPDKDLYNMFKQINFNMRNYFKALLVVVVILTTAQAIAFSFAKLPSPLIFALFCAITNMIPYIGPYIGAVPALIVASTISLNVTIGTFIAVILCQFFESNFLTPNIMSKTMKVHPVIIILGLSIASRFGILGMLLSTPIISCLKIIFNYFYHKYEKNNKKKGGLSENNLNRGEV